MIFNIKLLLLINHKYNFILYYLIVFLYMYFIYMMKLSQLTMKYIYMIN